MVARPGHAGSLSALRSRVRALSERAHGLAIRHSERPVRVLLELLAIGAVGAGIGIPLGLAVNDDPAEYFREGMPGTWLSALMFLAAAVAARAVHRQEPGIRWTHSFWGLSAAILLGLFVVELTQPTIYLGDWLEDSVGTVAPFGVTNVDAMLLIALLAGLFGVLARHAVVLLSHPLALALLVAAGVLGVGSQALDSFWPTSAWEFVAEESLKAAAGPFMVAGYLAGLRGVRKPSEG